MAFSVMYFDNRSAGLLIGVLTMIVATYVSQFIISWYRKIHHLRELVAKLPGPRGLPIIGNALDFSCKPEELLDRMIDVIKPYENVTPMKVWLGPRLHVVIAEPCDIEVVLNSQAAARRGLIYEFLYPVIGDGLISGSDQTWRAHRKMVAPMLNARILEGYVGILEKHSQILVDKLRNLSDGNEFDIMPYVSRCTIDGSCETIMGCKEINSQENPNQDFIHNVEKMYELVYNRMLKVWLYPDLLFRLSTEYQGLQKCKRVLNNFTEKLVAMKLQERSEVRSGKIVVDSDQNSILEQLIDQQLSGNKKLSNEELRDEIFTVYLAAQDTMALVSSFALLMLGIHKDVQNTVRKEVIGVLRDDSMTMSLLAELKYLDMVIKETMRLFPIAPFMVRTLRNDLILETCTLPKDCEVVIAALITHRSDRHWNNPDKFIPERFSAEEGGKRHPYAYIPFSGGLMGCIGQKYAMMSVKTIIANVVRNYSIDSTIQLEDIKIKSDISIRNVNSYQLSLKSL